MFCLSKISILFIAVVFFSSQFAFSQGVPSTYKRLRDASADNLNFIGVETHPGTTQDNSYVSYHWCRVTGNDANARAIYDCSSSYLGCRQSKTYTVAELAGERYTERWHGAGISALDLVLIVLTTWGASWIAGMGAVTTGTVAAGGTAATGGTFISTLQIDGAMILSLLKPLGTWSIFGVSVFGVAKYVKVLDPVTRFDKASAMSARIYGQGGVGADEVKQLNDFGASLNAALCDIDGREQSDIQKQQAQANRH